MSTDGEIVEPTPDDALGLAADALAMPAPAGVRDRVLGAVRGRPRARVTPATPVETLAGVMDDVGSLLASLTPSEWRAPHALGDLDVKATVAHLHGADHYLGVRVGLWDGPVPADETDHRAASAPHIAGAEQMTPSEVRDAWQEWGDALVEQLRALPAERLAEPAKYHTFESSLGFVLVARSFEVWTHGEDIRRATGRPLRPPRPAVLAAMTEAGAPIPAAAHQLQHGPMAATVRFVLTGEGGGTWTFPLGPDAPAEPDATVVAGAADFCRVIANRIAPADLDCDIEGDAELARSVLAGAGMLALD